MKVDQKQIEHIADLANLELSEDEKVALKSDFERVLVYIEKINELDVDNVPETLQIISLSNVEREDKIGNSLDREEMLELAPESNESQVKVPKFL